MSTKKGYIVHDANANWLIVEFPFSYKDGFGEKYPIHPSSLPTILSNGSLKPEYMGEVEYEVKEDWVKPDKGLNVYAVPKTYAIPKPVESKGDVWEEAWKECREHLKGKTFADTADYYLEMLNYLEKNYALTKKHP